LADGCVGFNTWGFLKSKIDKIQPVKWFSENDGIFVKKMVYEEYLRQIEEKKDYSSGNIEIKDV
jgi:hypothetical protein